MSLLHYSCDKSQLLCRMCSTSPDLCSLWCDLDSEKAGREMDIYSKSRLCSMWRKDAFSTRAIISKECLIV